MAPTQDRRSIAPSQQSKVFRGSDAFGPVEYCNYLLHPIFDMFHGITTPYHLMVRALVLSVSYHGLKPADLVWYCTRGGRGAG